MCCSGTKRIGRGNLPSGSAMTERCASPAFAGSAHPTESLNRLFSHGALVPLNNRVESEKDERVTGEVKGHEKVVTNAIKTDEQ